MDVYAFDVESHLIQPGLLAPPLVCGSLASGPGPGALLSKDEAREWFRWWALESDAHIVGANIAYDMAVMLADADGDRELVNAVFAAYEAGRVHDVQIAMALHFIAEGLMQESKIIDPRSPMGERLRDPAKGKEARRFSLATCADLALGRLLQKEGTWRLSYALLENTPVAEWPQEARDYPIADARTTLDVWLAQTGQAWPAQPGDEDHRRMPWPKGTPIRNLGDETRQTYAAFCGHLTAVWGMRTDPARVAVVVQRVEAQHVLDRARFAEAGIIRAEGAINPETGKPWPASRVGTTDTGKLKDLVTAAYLGSPPRTEPSDRHPEGQVKTDRDALTESGDDLLEAYGHAGENEKLYVQYLDVIRSGAAVPINPGFNPLVATGRTSYAQPNLQNLPREGGIRECFAARPGHVFCSVDYGTLELCTLAQVCLWLFNWSRLAEALKAGRDCHAQLAARIAGVSYDEARARLKAKDKQIKNLRQAAKPVNFGLPGGMGVPKLILTARKQRVRFCELAGVQAKCGAGGKTTTYATPNGRSYPCPPTCVACLELAEQYKGLWFAEWEEMRDYFGWVSERTGDGLGEIEQWGSGRVRGGLGFCDGANTSFQGLAGDGAKYALRRLVRECYTDDSSPLWGCRPVVFVHDEVIAELPEDRAHEAGERMAQVMRDAMAEWVPDVPITAEPALMRYWVKGAETVRDANGRLLVWEDVQAQQAKEAA